MTTIIERLRNDRTAGRKAHEARRVAVLTYVISEAEAIGKKVLREPNDDEVIRVIRGIIAKNNEVLQHKEVVGIQAENLILEEYLPSLMEEAELKQIINILIPQLGEKSPKMIGLIMARLKSEHPGQFEPAMASRIAKELLQG